ncbi:MAG TPA: hypothetical protein DEO32_01605 [Ruminococcaceae bacterium]|nr:hypothetical protein [Oscillospiraceae bacterium]
MSNKQLSGAMFCKMLSGGAANLSKNAQTVNDLNVFPIPDGDTGDNMLLTIDAGVSALRDVKETPLFMAVKTAANGMLLGARGNSGVILSRIFAGLAKGLDGVTEADVTAVSYAFRRAVDEAYGAVSNPVEGTILTVLKDGVGCAAAHVDGNSTIESFFKQMTDEFKLSLDRTPELLDVLREAGVVDSGGAGLIYIADGMISALEGNFEEHISVSPSGKRVNLDAFTEDSELEFGYCTEFLLRLQRSKTDIENFDINELINYLNGVGDSVVAFREGSIVKVHVHTKKPGDILNHCQLYGEFLTTKMENMTLQHNEVHGEETFVPKVTKPHKPYAVISVAAGKGIKDTFISLGCDYVVDGGQSMNPSAEDFLKAFESVNADVIFVFPNNGNIILTAQQAAQMYSAADVRVVNSKTIGDGYAAISMMDTSSNNTDEILAGLDEIISGVVTGNVSKAVRNAQMDGVEVSKGDFIGFANGKIISDSQNRNGAALDLAKKLNAGSYDILLVVCGQDASAQETGALFEQLRAEYPRLETVMIDGGQPVYDYIMIFE